MKQLSLILEDPQVNFLRNYRAYGFKNKSAMVRTALNRLEKEDRTLRESAELYAEVYDNDSELQELTQAAISGWPE